MKASDFRIGNLVVYNGSVFRVTRISKNIITADRGKGDVDFTLKDLQPLKITEFWLEKFGFKTPLNEFRWEMIINKSICFSAIQAVSCYSVGIAGPFGLFLFKMKYIHELQNIYHILSGDDFEFDILK